MRPRRRGPSPDHRISLRKAERRQLQRTSRSYGLPFRQVLRARIILVLEQDPCVSRAASELGVDVKTVRRWRDRFFTDRRFESLQDRPRAGRPPCIDAVARCQVIGMACGRPSDFGESSREVWTIDSLLASFRKHYPAARMSRTSLLRILQQAELRPHHIRMWLHSPDPRFTEKVREICRLYLSRPAGAVVLCVDEKSGIQALGRRYPLRRPSPARAGRMDYEYVRQGTRSLLAALNPHTGKVYGEVCAKRRASDLLKLMESLARRFRDQTVHVIWDNLNIHRDGRDRRWSKFNRRHGHRFRFHYTPLHASWLNQIEIFFSIVQRRVLRHGVFNGVGELTRALNRFLRHWNEHEAYPFRWTFKGYPLQSGRKAA